MNIIVDKLSLAYTDSGKGKIILYLHGWGSDRKSFAGLAKSLKGCRHIMVDLPGFGESQKPESAWGLEEYASIVAAFSDKLGFTADVIVAHSNGAAVAIKGLANDILTADKLIILGGAGIRQQDGKKRFLKVISKTGKLLTFALPVGTKERLSRAWYGVIGSELHMVKGMEETFRKTVGEDVAELSADVHTKTLLIYGENDEATPPIFGRIYQESMPNSELDIIANAGHYVFLDQPEAVLARINKFLESA